MNGRKLVAAVVVSSMLFASTAMAAAAPPVMTAVNCISTGMNARVVATVAPTLTTPRVFFRANGERSEYYVDMRRGNGANEWVGILPTIEPSTKSVTYRVAAMDQNKTWVVSPPVTLNTRSSCAGAALMGEDQRLANNIVLGLTTAGQSEVPPGFSCRGIVSVLDYDCRLRPAEGCRRLLAQGLTGVPAAGAATTAAAAAAAGAGASAAGLSAAALAALAAAGLAAGLLIYNQTQDGGAGGGQESASRP